ncbi:MAG: AprI/Inh family metalloprotease inhibitor [Nitratireductor sp.]|nr:AprI/Inh family metalloprotease inhibitor [Nitratireductor sp.]MCB1455643.1 AprI/Inh family metalloprotease inhibitor [Nitratireductor sp.]MCB1459743.1 AprI/Inh family metalloprotease inhibitor [Nitratireductor sp.]
MTRFKSSAAMVLVIGAGLAMSGCQSNRMAALDPGVPPAPLPSTPLEPVQTGQLPPLDAQGQPMATNGQTDVASLDPNAAPLQPSAPAAAPSGAPVTREGMAGTWTVASDNPDCRIILAFTKWSGGYRAATRRCNTAELAAVTAWDVKDNRVVLVDSNGNQVASLYSSGAERYDGTTNGGKPIRFSR